MTRQEALDKIYIDDIECKEHQFMMKVKDVHDLVNEIFDFFENKQSKYEPIHKSSIDNFKKVDDAIKRCKSCKWFDHKRGICDHCAFGYPYVDQNGKTPSQVGNCTIYTPKE